MYDPLDPQISRDRVAELASDMLADLYRAVCGHQAMAVRAYHDDDALLLLLRFDPSELEDTGETEHALESAFGAIPEMIASAIEARSGTRMSPGNLSVCADRGLAVFAFSAAEDGLDDDSAEELSFEDELAAAAQGARALRSSS